MSIGGGGVVARLRTVMGFDGAEFEAGTKRAEGTAGSFQNTIKNVGIAIAGAFTVGKIVEWGKSFVDWAGRISDAATNVGILTSEMAALNKVFATHGLGVDELQKMFAKLETDIFNAATGSKKLDDVYGQLGFTLKDLVAMEPAELFREVTKRALESASPTATLAELFGAKVGPKARVALEEVVKGYDKVEEATGKLIDRIDKAGDSWAAWKEKWNLNVMTPIAGGLADLKDGFGDLFNVIFSKPKGVNWFNFAGKHEAFYNEKAEKNSQAEKDAAALKKKNMEEMARLAEEQKRKADEEAQNKGFDEADKKKAAIVAARIKATQERQAREAEEQKIKDDQDNAKIQKNRERAQARDRYQERLVAIAENTRGTDVNPDSYARIGGFMGGERAGMAAVDRQIRVTEENTKAKRELTEAMKALEYKFSASTGDFTETPSLGVE